MPGWVWVVALVLSVWTALGLVTVLFLGRAADLRDAQRPEADRGDD